MTAEELQALKLKNISNPIELLKTIKALYENSVDVGTFEEFSTQILEQIRNLQEDFDNLPDSFPTSTSELTNDGDGESEFATEQYVGNKIDEKLIPVNESLETLTGEGEGSVKQTVADEVAKVVGDAPESFNTLKEIADWISAHPESVAEINSRIQANAADIAQKADKSELDGYIAYTPATSDKYRIFGTDGSGEVAKYALAESADKNTIPKRDSNGAVKTAAPTANDDATPKSYVDSKVAERLTQSQADGRYSQATNVKSEGANSNNGVLIKNGKGTRWLARVEDNGIRFNVAESDSSYFDANESADISLRFDKSDYGYAHAALTLPREIGTLATQEWVGASYATKNTVAGLASQLMTRIKWLQNKLTEYYNIKDGNYVFTMKSNCIAVIRQGASNNSLTLRFVYINGQNESEILYTGLSSIVLISSYNGLNKYSEVFAMTGKKGTLNVGFDINSYAYGVNIDTDIADGRAVKCYVENVTESGTPAAPNVMLIDFPVTKEDI